MVSKVRVVIATWQPASIKNADTDGTEEVEDDEECHHPLPQDLNGTVLALQPSPPLTTGNFGWVPQRRGRRVGCEATEYCLVPLTAEHGPLTGQPRTTHRRTLCPLSLMEEMTRRRKSTRDHCPEPEPDPVVYMDDTDN